MKRITSRNNPVQNINLKTHIFIECMPIITTQNAADLKKIRKKKSGL